MYFVCTSSDIFFVKNKNNSSECNLVNIKSDHMHFIKIVKHNFFKIYLVITDNQRDFEFDWMTMRKFSLRSDDHGSTSHENKEF